MYVSVHPGVVAEPVHVVGHPVLVQEEKNSGQNQVDRTPLHRLEVQLCMT